mmetsp:Transcript_3211/g.9807  ORF Transcript_3211/g.9807 Transcript_3211/m.9807 type:complete len:265 (+) Transcript_3211:746-1540(+)
MLASSPPRLWILRPMQPTFRRAGASRAFCPVTSRTSCGLGLCRPSSYYRLYRSARDWYPHQVHRYRRLLLRLPLWNESCCGSKRLPNDLPRAGSSISRQITLQPSVACSAKPGPPWFVRVTRRIPLTSPACSFWHLGGTQRRSECSILSALLRMTLSCSKMSASQRCKRPPASRNSSASHKPLFLTCTKPLRRAWTPRMELSWAIATMPTRSRPSRPWPAPSSASCTVRSSVSLSRRTQQCLRSRVPPQCLPLQGRAWCRSIRL